MYDKHGKKLHNKNIQKVVTFVTFSENGNIPVPNKSCTFVILLIICT